MPLLTPTGAALRRFLTKPSLLALATTLAVGAALAFGVRRLVTPAAAQEQAPARKEFTITARDFRFMPSRIEVGRDDIVHIVVKSEDVAYGFTIDDYRVSKRVPAGGSVVFDLHADREGSFPFYSNLTTDARHSQMKGELVVRRR